MFLRFLLTLLLSTAAHAEDLRLLTFNIRYANRGDGEDRWDLRREHVATVIRQQADVAGLQEVLPEQRAWLEKALPEFGFAALGRERDDQGEAVPVLWRKDRIELIKAETRWLSDTPEVPASTTWGNKLPRIVTSALLRDLKTKRTFRLHNVHLDHESQPARERAAEYLARLAAETGDAEPALILGDFNASPDNPAFTPLTAKWVSTYDSLGQPAAGTFHGFTGQARGGAIDFIFVQRGRWQVKSNEILKPTYPGADGQPRQVSDHFPVRAAVAPAQP